MIKFYGQIDTDDKRKVRLPIKEAKGQTRCDNDGFLFV